MCNHTTRIEKRTKRKRLRNVIEKGILGLMLLAVFAAVAFPVGADNTASVEKKIWQQEDRMMGSFGQNIPLELPLGTDGIEPELSLDYSSYVAGNLGVDQQPGVLGLGWSLKGANDRVIKIGSRYVLILNGVGYDIILASDGYHTNPESYMKLTLTSDMWTVVDTNGNIYRFGQTADSRLKEAVKNTDGTGFQNGEIQVWSLDEKENVNGIKMKMFYAKFTDPKDGHERSLIPSRIEYNFGPDGNLIGNKKEVVFEYETVVINDLYKSTGHWDDQKLVAITTKINDLLVKKYTMDYVHSKVSSEGNFQNSGLETGDTSGWNTFVDRLQKVSVVSKANTGCCSLEFYVENSYGDAKAWQTVRIPRDAPNLRYYVDLDSTNGGFSLKVIVEDSNGETLVDEVTKEPEGSGFDKRDVGLSRWAGQEVRIIFLAEGDPWKFGTVQIDDVSLGLGDGENGFLLLNSVLEWSSDGTNFVGSLPIGNFTYGSENLLNRTVERFGGATAVSYESFIPQTEIRGVYANDQTRSRVTNITQEDRLGGRAATQYLYKDEKGSSTELYSLNESEYRGNKEVTAIDPTGKKTKSFFNQTDDAKGMLERSEVWGNDGNLYSAVKNTIETKSIKINLPEGDQFNNFDFESGSTVGWYIHSEAGGDAATTKDGNNGSKYSLMLSTGTDIDGAVFADQEISLSQDAKWLSFYAKKMILPEGTKFQVWITDSEGHAVFKDVLTDDWKEYKIDVSAWADQKISVSFAAYHTMETSEQGIVFVDDIKLLHKTDLVTSPFVSETRETSYQGENFKDTKTIFSRDEFDNIIDAIEYGEYDFANNQDVGNDTRETSVEYINNRDLNILGVPKHSTIHGYNLNDKYVLQRESWMYYDDLPYGELSKGQLTKKEAKKDNETNISTEQGYDLYGNIVSTIDANKNINPATGHTTDVEFDPIYHMYPIRNCNALNFCSEIGYDQLMRPIAITDINGQTTMQKFDGFGRVIAEVKPGDSLEDPTVRTQYGDAADFANGTYPFILTVLKDGTDDGLRRYRFFDGFSNIIQTKAEGVNESEWLAVDMNYSLGKLERSSVPYTIVTATPEQVVRKDINESGIWTVFGYDPVGRQNLITKPDGTSTETVFGLWMTEFYDALRHKMAEYKDGLGMKTKVENYLGSSPETYQLYATTSFKHNTGSGELVKLTDPAGNEQITDFNLLGWKNWMNDPDRGNWSYLYNNNGVVTSQTDAKDQTINFTLDLKDRVVLKDYPGQFDTRYEYDSCAFGKGRLCLTSGGDKKFSIESKPSYDERGRTANIQLTINNKSWNISTSHDSMDRIVNTTYPDGEVVTQRQNSAGFLGSSDGVIPAVQSNLYKNYPYLENVFYSQGKPTGYKYGNNRTTSLEYNDGPEKQDPNNGRSYTYQLIRVSTDGGVQDLGLGHDDIGNVVKAADSLNATNSADYALDDLSRLISANSGAYGGLEFANDNIGNFINKEGLLYVYPASGPGSIRPHAPLSIGNESFQYDANGNMNNSSNGRSLVYNFDNLVSKIFKNQKVEGSYFYLDGKRVVKIENDITTYYVGDIFEEEHWKNGSYKSSIKYYFLRGATAIRTNNSAGNAALKFVHKDYLGSSTSATNSKGELKLRIGYKPYGEEISLEGNVKEIKNRFTGKEKDTTGLYCNSARCYNPAFGIFLSPDPFQGPNRYEYVKSNPVNVIDPSGNFIVLAAAVPYVMAALPTITLVATGYLASNWEEDIGAGFTGADVASFAMPLPIGGKAKIAKKIAEEAFETVAEKTARLKLRAELAAARKETAVILEEPIKEIVQTGKKEVLNQPVKELNKFEVAKKIAATADNGGYKNDIVQSIDWDKLPKEERIRRLKEMWNINK